MKFNRTHALAARAKDDEGLIEIAVSSEEPVERWYGIEVLRHTPDAVDLSRLNDGRHPFLMEHDRHIQVGVIKSSRLDSDKMVRSKVKFSRSAFGKEIEQDVADEIRTLISVGYAILEVEEQEKDVKTGELKTVRTLAGDQFEREMRELHGDDFTRAGPARVRAEGKEPPVYVMTRWMPYEASLVAIPADVTVGVGRSAPERILDEDRAADAGGKPEAAKDEDRAAGAGDKSREQEAIQSLIHQETVMDKTPAELEIERRDAILALGETYAKYVEQKDIADHLRGQKTEAQFREFIMSKMMTAHSDNRALALNLTAKEVRRYSLGRALVAAISGDWTQAGFERECSGALAKMTGRSPEGFFVPFEAFQRDFNVGTGTEAGNLVPTDLRGDLYVDALRNSLVLGRMGAMFLTGLTGNIDLPRKTTPTSLTRLTEIGSASETNPLTAKVSLTPKRVGGYVEVSKQALIQSAIPLENMIRNDLLMSGAVELEDQCINGNGTAPNILGLRNYTTIGSVVGGTNGAALSWDALVDLESACANSNAEPDRLSGYITNTRARGKAKKTQMGTNLPFIWQNGEFPLNGYRAGITNNVPSNLTKGTSTTVCSAAIFGADWSMAVIGLFGAPDIVVDPYTKADTGQVKITLNQFSDMGVRQPAAFAVHRDLLTT